jgi:hypothetical protein
MMDNKLNIIDEIKHLISVDGSNTHINPNYLDYFELEELEEIKDTLLTKKANKDKFTTNYVNELFESLQR